MTNPFTKARELFQGGKSWGKGAYAQRRARLIKGEWQDLPMEQAQFCSLGAVRYVETGSLGHYDSVSMTLLKEALVETHPDWAAAVQSEGLQAVILFNDSKETTFEMVDAMFERAEKLWERDHE